MFESRPAWPIIVTEQTTTNGVVIDSGGMSHDFKWGILMFVKYFNMGNGIFQSLVAVVTMIVLCRVPTPTKESRDNVVRSSYTILILSLILSFVSLYLFTLLLFLDKRDEKYFEVLFFAGFPFSMMMLSAVNPIIIITRSRRIKKFLSACWKGGEVRRKVLTKQGHWALHGCSKCNLANIVRKHVVTTQKRQSIFEVPM